MQPAETHVSTVKNFAIALATVSSSAWLDYFAVISPVLALLLQVLGIALALLQIIRLLRDWNRHNPQK